MEGLDRAASCRSADIALALEVVRCSCTGQWTEAEVLGDFLEARCVALPVNVALQVTSISIWRLVKGIRIPGMAECDRIEPE